LKYGEWKLALNPPGDPLSETLAAEVISSYKRATDSLSHDYRAWHSWALINFRLAEQLHGSDKEQSSKKDAEAMAMLQNHVIAAVKGENKICSQNSFLADFNSTQPFVLQKTKAFGLAISIGTKRWSASVQQDMLNLLSCLFKYGELPGVSKTINDGLGKLVGFRLTA
jgi:FKBP12-rapamycin complex-associated protein